MKTTKIIFWTTTVIFFLFEGVMPALFGQTKEAKEGITHLGYPEYFGLTLVIFKVIGALCLIIPMVPARVKEWAYACFAVEIIFAAISHTAVEGFTGQSVFPLVILAILIVSYRSYHKLQAANNKEFATA
jgi:hypothetical protein